MPHRIPTQTIAFVAVYRQKPGHPITPIYHPIDAKYWTDWSPCYHLEAIPRILTTRMGKVSRRAR
jgi:hypothetical protein